MYNVCIIVCSVGLSILHMPDMYKKDSNLKLADQYFSKFAWMQLTPIPSN